MSDSNIKDENYYIISGFMITRLGLKGVPLNVYAIIYGFSQDGESEFTGSLQYLCDFCGGVSKPTVIKALKELTEAGLIIRREERVNSICFPRYKVNLPLLKNFNGGSKETLTGAVKDFNGGSKETLPNNINTNNKSLIDKEKVREIIDLYNSICVSYPSVRVVSAAREKAILERLGTYSLEDFKTVFENAEASSFLKGINDRKWSATFDWLIKDRNMPRVLEGVFADRQNQGGRTENLPGWFESKMGDAEREAIQRALTESEQAEADQLRRELQASFGKRG